MPSPLPSDDRERVARVIRMHVLKPAQPSRRAQWLLLVALLGLAGGLAVWAVAS